MASAVIYKGDFCTHFMKKLAMSMPLILSRMILAIILAVVIKGVDGSQRIVHVSDHELIMTSDDEDFASGEDPIASGEDDNSLICCVYGNCSCSSLDHALANLTSNVLINITTDVTLSSLVRASDLENVSIIGHNNPTVNCKKVNGIQFAYSRHLIIQGITWIGCGAKHTKPGLLLGHSFNVTIQNCTFQHSVGQAIVLLQMSGVVNINNCKFVNNSHYRGHGAAIHYSSSTNNTINYYSEFVLTIQNCNFSYYKMKSLVYLENKCNKIILNNSTFYYNQGISVYAINHNEIYLSGKILFESNTADNGAGIYISDHSTVTFVNNSEVTFIQNSAKHKGGAVFLRNHSSIIFDQNSVVDFINNGANNGIVYSDTGSNVTFKATCHVTFSGNSARYHGAAIYSDNSLVTFTGNCKVTFSSHYTYIIYNDDFPFSLHIGFYTGGGIYSINYSNISFEGSSTTLFINNTASRGGAIYSSGYSSISFEGSSTTRFNNNRALVGGAIYKNFGSISFKGNASTMFSNNDARFVGGAIELQNVNMIFGGNSTTVFNDNDGAHLGGAIYSFNSNITFEGISTTVYNNNTAFVGGAINSEINKYSAIFSGGDISFNENSNTEFRDNTANGYGGAIFLNKNLTFIDNSTVNFTNNKARMGAIIFSNGESNKIVEIGNPTVIFNDHTVNWCTNTCLSHLYTHREFTTYEDDVITIDSNGTVRCSEQEAFVSLNRKCHSNNQYLEDILVKLTSNGLATLSNKVTISSIISLTKLYNVSIIGNKNHSITCINNAGLQLEQCSNITIEGLNWVGCGADTTPVINILNSSDVTLQNCLFQQSKGPAVVMFELSGYMKINHCKFINNTEHSGHGAAIHYSSVTETNSQLTYVISNCNFTYNEGTSLVYINDQTEDTNISLCNSSFFNNIGISVYLSSNTLHIDGVVLFENNAAENGAGIYINKFSKVMFDDSSNVKFINNFVNHSGAAVFLNNHSSVLFDQNSVVAFNDNNAINGIIYSVNNSNVTFKGTSEVTFSSNSATQYGAAICSSNNSLVTFTGNSNVMFNNNVPGQSINLGGTVYCEYNSSLIFEDNSAVAFHNNTGYNGGAILSQYNSVIIFKDTSTVMFNNNKAHNSGGALFADSGTVAIKDNSTVTFNSNKAFLNGGAVYFGHHINWGNAFRAAYNFSSNIVSIFEFANVTFKNNIAHQNGGAMYCGYQQIFMFGGNSMVTFSGNNAKDGGVFHATNMCKIIFSSSAFSNNDDINGGTILSSVYSDNSFIGTSTVTFNNNAADNGGTFYLTNSATLIFNDNVMITLKSNRARQNGGVIYSMRSSVLFNGNSIVLIADNEATLNGGVMYCDSNSNIAFSGFTNVSFKNNTATNDGGAINIVRNSNIMVNDNTTITFTTNNAQYGGVMYCDSNSYITFSGFTNVSFSDNNADNGGVLFANNNSKISFEEASSLTFIKNEARRNGGAGYFNGLCSVTFKQNADVTFENNNALYGGAIWLNSNTNITFNDNSIALFKKNMAKIDGGAINIVRNSNITFSGFTSVSFSDNNADNGAVLFANNNSKISFEEASSLTFIKNEARSNGGAGYFNGFCSVTFKQQANVTFENNNALYGGAICLNSNTNITFTDNSVALFKNNMATNDGGAINIVINSRIMVNDNTTITFTTNNAQYGGAMFFDATHTTLAFNKNERNINFNHNTAIIAGSYMYFDSTGSNESGSCLSSRIDKYKAKQFITTPPSKLQFFAPAICIDYDNKTGECNTYHLKHIMLGEEINIPVHVSNYCNQPSYSTQFRLQGGNNQNYSISGSNPTLLSGNDTFQGISIISNTSLAKSSNYTINIIMQDDRNSDWKQISVNLTIQLTSCYPGFWQNSGSVKCECYNANGIVFCSGSNSTIKRGYWFGKVAEQPTVTICPVNYCDFTCCEASNGYYHLSPVRDNQCRSHRSGTACGSCTDGYTLSFDSPKCVNVDSCTAGQTVLVILLTVTYWIVMVTLVFAMMYYKVPIGYLYSITYYYSIVDILLSQNLQDSRSLYLTVSIMSSFSKITPQFLGELCLTTGMSGIDQQFIHYIHPLALIMILIIISLSARSSIRISAIISRGIIHVICLLLLLSYTSIASTSLLLMRPLMFHGIDKVHTSLSPDIEYFHGRHLAYGIVALICIITIVLGLPFLLMFEPFLNHKINFIKIKPLLDQFQGCYKDKYRCFAGCYMICRLVIITIVIANSSNDLVANYLLIVICGVIALIHLLVKPYSKKILNKLDGVILQLILFNTILPFLDDFGSPLVITITFVLVILPFLNFIAVTLFLHKNDLKKMVVNFTFKKSKSNDVINKELPKEEFELVIDDSVRQNVTICDT